MSSLRFTPRHLVGGLLLSVVLWGCDTQTPVEVPDTSQQARGGVVEDQVSQAAKQAGLRPSGPAPQVPDPSPLSYGVQQIPFEPGPTGLANLGPVCDDCVMNDVPIGFNFTFYGNTYSSLQISSNGFVRFNPPNNDSGCCSGRPIPLNDLWNNIIAFAWTDLNPSGELGGRLRWETLGEAPNRRWVLHADSVRYFGGTVTNLIQWLVLHEGSNEIEIHTQVMTPRVITQGIENINGSEAHFVPGRVATTFSLTNDGVRFTPLQIVQVDIETAYSGDPPQDPGVISLQDEWVYVEILDPLQYRPNGTGAIPFQSPNDVRIGPSWETGVPAESYELLDLNNDDVLDIRLRWDLDALRDAGHLPPGQTTLTVWGQENGLFYRGTVQVTVVTGGVVIFDNGPFITHPGAGAGGADVHMAATNFLASNARRIGAGPHFRIADRFTIPAGGANVSLIRTRALINDLAQPNWNFFSMNIWDGRPGDPGASIIASTSSASWAWSGAYAIFMGDPLGSTNFPIFDKFWDIPVALAAGDYWIDWQVDGSNAWAIYVTHPNPNNPNQPILGMGVGRQMVVGGVWQDLLAGEPGVPHQPGTPFQVIGEQMGGATGPAFRQPDHGLPQSRPRPGGPIHSTEPHLRQD